MRFENTQMRFGYEPDAGQRWSHGMHETGLICRFDAQKSVSSNVTRWKLGDIGVSQGELTALALSPVAESQPSWQGEWLYVKLITGGHVDIDQSGQSRRFKTGSMLVVDPVLHFDEVFFDRTQITVLRVPKARLHERGFRSTTHNVVVADMQSPDMIATSQLIHCIVGQQDATSPLVRARFGEQLLDLVDIVLSNPTGSSKRRNSQALVFAAKRYIQAHLADKLDPGTIAAAVHVGAKHLQRLFAAQGTSLMRYVWQVRLDKAEHLLRQSAASSISIQEIAWQCGFSSAAHFSRMFKSRCGEAPCNVRGEVASHSLSTLVDYP